jgi:N-acyl homoserine lactone hydrolase
VNPDAVTVELEVMLTGETPTPEGYVFRGGGIGVTRVASVLASGLLPIGGTVNLACVAYIVRHPSAGTILIDTGFHPDASGDRRKDFGLAMSLVFRSLRPAEEPYEAQLQARGVEPSSVKRVIMTHLHVDHTSGMRLLPHAQFICSRREWQAANGHGAEAKGFVAHHFPPESRVDLVDFELAAEPYGPFGETIDLLGDGSIRLVSTPGHTQGHLSVLLQLTDNRRVLVVGDAAYTLRSIERQILPLITVNDKL